MMRNAVQLKPKVSASWILYFHWSYLTVGTRVRSTSTRVWLVSAVIAEDGRRRGAPSAFGDHVRLVPTDGDRSVTRGAGYMSQSVLWEVEQ
jgi:hypothetical protein